MDCGTLRSVAFVVEDHLEAELSFTVATGFEVSGFLVAAGVVAVVGFLATVAEGGRLTSDEKRETTFQIFLICQ